MVSGIFIALVLVFGVFDSVASYWTDSELNTIQDFNGSAGLPLAYDIRTKRLKKGLYGVSGSVTITDAYDDYEVEVNLFYSSNGGTDWKPTAAQVKRSPLCDKMEKEYRNIFMPDIHPYSNLPYTEDTNQAMCPLFTKGEYYIKDYQYDATKIPKVMQAGLYKGIVKLWKGDIVTSGIEVVLTLS